MRHGIYNITKDTETSISMAAPFAQVVIGTAPVHYLSNPAMAVNRPILCKDITDCYTNLGYSEDFNKYTLCQSMFASFRMYKVAPVVFINVLNPDKHYTSVGAKEYTVNNNSVSITDDVIVSTLVINNDSKNIEQDRYTTEWNDGILTINFLDDVTGSISIAYNKIDATKVTASDIIGAVDIDTDMRTGSELLKIIFPSLGIVPFIITAPGWTTNDTVASILAAKSANINGCYKAMTIVDIDSFKARTRNAAIEDKNSRTLDENCIAVYPCIKKSGKIIAYSALLSALIMHQALSTDGVTCKSPSNQRLSIDDVVLADGTSVYYDQEDGNELNAAGIVTVISRNGLYSWGNSTAAYPQETDPVKRWIMTRLSFLYIENDFINSNFSNIDGAISRKLVENIITDENIKLASYAAAGYIAAGTISYHAGDNPDKDIMNGHFTFRTSLAGNIPAEVIENIFSFDVDALKTAILGGVSNE